MTRLRLLKVLVAHPDPRSVPALRKALQEYARAPKDKNYPDLALACEGAAAVPRSASAELEQDLLAAFLVFRFTTQTGGQAYKPLTRALLAHRARSWAKPLIRVALLNTAMQLMKPDQASQVEASIKSFGSSEQAKQFALAKALVLKCTDTPQCYLAELLSPENQTPERVSVSTKAAHMLAAFGDTATRDQLVHGWGSIGQPEVALVAADAIDHLTPNGSRELADELEALVNSRATSPRTAQLTTPLQSLAYRLRARAPERSLGKDG